MDVICECLISVIFVTACPDEAWEALEGAFDQEPSQAAVGSPAYLSIPSFDSCLGTDRSSPGQEVWCMPEKMPQDCPIDSWTMLKEKFTGDDCLASHIIIGDNLGALPPAYLSLPDFDRCLDVYQASGIHTALCLPSMRHEDCSHSSWNDLKRSFDGIICPDKLLPPPQAWVGPPEHLLVPSFDSCLQDFQASPAHRELCLPRSKPGVCPEPSWLTLLDVFDGVQCPAEKVQIVQAIAPAWLAVPGHQTCLKVYDASASHQEYCLPTERPDKCNLGSWNDLEGIWDSVICAPAKPDVVQAGPPEYLSVPGFKDCLDTYEPSASHSVHCLPQEIPTDCNPASYSTLSSGAFSGIKCPKDDRIFPTLGGPETVTPAYLSVPSFSKCLDTYQGFESLHSEFCLPRSQPTDCPESSWNRIASVFLGIGCPPPKKPSPVQIGPPAYLSVIGHDVCLGSYTSLGSTSSTRCLPVEQPTNCYNDAWEQLLDVNIFSGIKCPPIHGGQRNHRDPQPSSYLSLPDHGECLVEFQASYTTKENCIPLAPPPGCSEETFNTILAFASRNRMQSRAPAGNVFDKCTYRSACFNSKLFQISEDVIATLTASRTGFATTCLGQLTKMAKTLKATAFKMHANTTTFLTRMSAQLSGTFAYLEHFTHHATMTL